MITMKQTVFLLLVLILSACTAQSTLEPTPTASAPFVIKQEENPYAPKTEDVSLKQDGVILTSVDLSERYDLAPLRTELHVLGSMPSVCSELRIKVNPPDNKYQISIEIYSIADINLKCENVFQQFETTILLGAYSAGQYTVWVNENFVGSIASY
jgi:hypothetical protein